MCRCHKGTVHVTGGFWLLILWFASVNGGRLLAMILSAAALHELGHYLTLRALGARVWSLRISVFGAELSADEGRLSYRGELLGLLAGPAFNLAAGLALAALGGRWTAPAGAHLVLGILNLLPIRPLDGGKALFLLASWTAGPAAGEWAAKWIGSCTAAGLACFLVWLMCRSGGSLWLLPPFCGLILAVWDEWSGYGRFS